MSWIENLVSRLNHTHVLLTEKSFTHDGCPIILDAIPDSSAILDVDELIIAIDIVKNAVQCNPICDLVAVFENGDKPCVIFIEAKTDRTHTNARTREAINQLNWSLSYFAPIIIRCSLLPMNFTRYAVLTYTNINDAVLRSPSVKNAFRHFRRQNRIKVHYVRAGTDIWQAIQGNIA